MRIRSALVLGTGLLFASASLSAQDGPPAPTPAPREIPEAFRPVPLGEGPWDYDSETGKLHVEVLARDIDHPWSLAFIPGGDMLVTERPGRLRLIRGGVLDSQEITGLPALYNVGIAGLYDIALHPDFANNRLLYISYTKVDPDDPQNATLAVLRAKWDGGHALADVEDIFVADAWYGKRPLPEKCCGQGPPFGSFGGRITFDDKGYLFVASGDRNFGERVQDPSNHFGKILRLKDDGSVPDDNPFVGKEGWAPEIWTLGHRNPLGLFYDAPTGRLWETEFGPRGGDEINLIEKGKNYGWIDVTQGHHYNGEPAKGIRNVEGMTDPVYSFGPPSINPGNIAVYRGAAFPDWEGDLLMPTMSKSFERIEITRGTAVTAMQTILKEPRQRYRDVKIGPDGAVYILTDETEGALLKVSPGQASE